MKILYNVGVSDIIFYLLNKYNEKQLFRPNNLYDLTKMIYDELKNKEFKFDKEKFSIDLSNLSVRFDEEIFYYLEFPIIKYFMKFDEFILIGTEQEKKDFNSAKDTYYLAKILELILSRLNKKVKVIKLQKNPVDLKEMVSFYKEIIKIHNPDVLNVTTGTPIQNIALSLLAYKFDKKLIYKPWSKDDNIELWDLKELVGE